MGMANNEWDDDLDADGMSGTDLVKKLRAEAKRLQKERDEAKEQAAGLQKKVRQTEVRSILEEVGVNPKVARFVLNDLEDVTKESVAEWVNENGELFGVSLGKSEQAAAAAPQGMSADEAQALAAINQFSTAETPGSNVAEIEKFINDPDTTPEQLIARLGLNNTRAF